MKEKIKEVRLIGPNGPIKNDTIDIKISFVEPDTFVPRHSEEAEEMLQILEGDEVQIGLAVDDWVERSDFHVFPPTFPKVVKVSANKPFVAISAKVGKLNGKLWLNDEDINIGTKYLGITECTRNVEEYFDNVANDYERAMRTWGYCMPELLSNALVKYGNIKPTDELKVVDLGCGDGAVGKAMYEKGFTNLTGVDISSKMMDIAAKKGVYSELKKANLLEALPFEKETFDLSVTSAVTTYLGESYLSSVF